MKILPGNERLRVGSGDSTRVFLRCLNVATLHLNFKGWPEIWLFFGGFVFNYLVFNYIKETVHLCSTNSLLLRKTNL